MVLVLVTSTKFTVWTPGVHPGPHKAAAAKQRINLINGSRITARSFTFDLIRSADVCGDFAFVEFLQGVVQLGVERGEFGNIRIGARLIGAACSRDHD